LVGIILNREESKRIPWSLPVVLLLVFIAWMLITTSFALYPSLAWGQLEKVAKIQLMVFVTMMVVQSKERVVKLVWIMALSLGFYGVKGGVFTVLHGGVYRVQGPMNTFIGGNNEIALALIMTIPLLRFLQLQVTKRWLHLGLAIGMLLTGIAIIGSQSRGALIGISAMAAFLWLKSRNKAFTALAVILVAGAVLMIMPEKWHARIATIETYQQDRSAMGRISAWWTAYNLARDRVTGGGFETFHWAVFMKYSPTPELRHDAHSIYFEVLGEHGFPGLAIFLAIGLATWSTAGGIIRRTKKIPESKWAADLAAMIQVSLVGYAAAGAFLGMAYFDFYYALIAVTVALRVVVDREGVETEPALERGTPSSRERTPDLSMDLSR
jgi:probable O-glycosylation ligase (exosortase A-associated)